MIETEDLIGIPFVEFGRDAKTGLDCYGLCIECAKRMGKTLTDVVLEKFDHGKVRKVLPSLNVQKIDNIEEGAILEYYGIQDNRLHVAFALSERLFIHATESQGVRISSVNSCKSYLRLENIYRII